MKLNFFISVLLLILMGVGCNKTTPSSHQPGDANAPHGSSSPSAVISGAVLAGSRVQFQNKDSLEPGMVNFTFKLYGTNGKEMISDDLKIEHEKRMHFLLVRDDMTDFQHLHPEYKDGTWAVQTTIAEAGQYELYVDIVPEKEPAVILRIPVQIGGPTAAKKFPIPNVDNTIETDDIKVRLESEQPILQNRKQTLTFVVTKNNQAVKTIGPYLGVYGHVVLLRHGSPDNFFHVHPLTDTPPTDGRVQFSATFPVAGRYTVYAQFNIASSVHTFPITVDVENRKKNVK